MPMRPRVAGTWNVGLKLVVKPVVVIGGFLSEDVDAERSCSRPAEPILLCTSIISTLYVLKYPKLAH